MLQIQLWKEDQLVSSKTADTTKDANAVIDRQINDIHSGKYGEASFLLNAYHVGRLEVFVGHYWSGRLSFPLKTSSE